ncbi:MAG: amidase [Steroidobacteraceae bacterium]
MKTMDPLDQYLAGEISSVKLIEDCLEVIARRNDDLGALTHVDADRALDAARMADMRRARNQSLGVLDGVPMSVKANIAVADWPHTAGMRTRYSARAERDAYVIARARDAGLIPLCQSNMDEAALGADGVNPWFLTTDNPRLAGYCAGGSSAGAAAALASGMCHVAIGTDTIGSVRIPAAFCSVAALKPTFGLVSTANVVPVHLRFDHVGPMTREVRHLSAVTAAIAGFDRSWPWSFPVNQTEMLRNTRPRLGVATGLDQLMTSGPVSTSFAAVVDRLRSRDCELLPFDLAPFDLPGLRRAILTLCERSMWREHGTAIGNQPQEYSDRLRAFIRAGGQLSDDELTRCEEKIARFHGAWLERFQHLDALLLPAVATATYPRGARPPQNTADLTAPASATGQPALVVPMPRAAGSPPAGLQIIGPMGSDFALPRLLDGLGLADPLSDIPRPH